MSTACPICNTESVVPRRVARKTATAIGGIAGAIQGVSSAMAASKAGDIVLGSDRIGMLALVIVSSLLGGAAGCITGAAFGEAIEGVKPNDIRCQQCGHLFQVATP